MTRTPENLDPVADNVNPITDRRIKIMHKRVTSGADLRVTQSSSLFATVGGEFALNT